MVEANYNVLDIINLMKTLSVHQYEDNIDSEAFTGLVFHNGYHQSPSQHVCKMRVRVYTRHFSRTT